MNKTYDILVVEDEPVVLDAIKKILGVEKFKFDETTDVKSTLNKLRQNTYRLIISDLMLPKLSGYDLMETVQKEFPCIPLIMITGYATLENAIQSLKMGCFDYIPKPFDIEIFLGTVKRGLKYGETIRAHSPDQCRPPASFHPPGDPGRPGLRYFLSQHSWAKLDEKGTALIGVGLTFPNMIENLESIDFPPVNGEVLQGKACVQIITQSKLVHVVRTPLSGRVVAVNHELEHNIQLINTDPDNQGWLLQIVPYDLKGELKNLVCLETKEA